MIYIFWHRHIFFTIFKFKNTGARPLISLSQDGEIVSRVAREFGMNPVRGSSSRGGTRAFLELLQAIKGDKSEILITADGPKGPPGEIKDGIILLAQKSEAVIVPIGWYSRPVKIMEKTWDGFLIPLPFGKIRFAYGEPYTIPPGISRPGFNEERKKLKKMLDDLERKMKDSFQEEESWAN